MGSSSSSSSLVRAMQSNSNYTSKIRIHDMEMSGTTSDMTGTSTKSRITESLMRVLLQLKDRCVKYSEYAPDIYCSVERNTNVWWFPCDFCQSRLGDRQTGSNACTLIVVILAHRIEGHDIDIFGHTELPLSRHLVSALAESIIDGNEIHERLVNDGVLSDINLTLPEALTACGRCNTSFNCRTTNKRLTEWRSVFQEMPMNEDRLFDDLHRGIVEWETKFRVSHNNPTVTNSTLYVVVIGGGQSVLCVYQRHLQKVTLLDTHSHRLKLEHDANVGAVVAQVTIGQLRHLCEWYVNIYRHNFGRNPDAYEVSFLNFKEESKLNHSPSTSDTLSNEDSICVVDT